MTHPARQGLERRIWRLAFLLSGDREGAAALVDRILDAQAKPEALEPARLDRLVIQQARGLLQPIHERPDPNMRDAAMLALQTARSLSEQPREAWILARIDGVDELWMSRAMDCSRTAAKVHLGGADDQMKSRLGARYDAAVDALRRFADSLDPGPIIAAHRTELRKKLVRRRTALITLGGIGVLAALLAVIKFGVL